MLGGDRERWCIHGERKDRVYIENEFQVECMVRHMVGQGVLDIWRIFARAILQNESRLTKKDERVEVPVAITKDLMVSVSIQTPFSLRSILRHSLLLAIALLPLSLQTRGKAASCFCLSLSLPAVSGGFSVLGNEFPHEIPCFEFSNWFLTSGWTLTHPALSPLVVRSFNGCGRLKQPLSYCQEGVMVEQRDKGSD